MGHGPGRAAARATRLQRRASHFPDLVKYGDQLLWVLTGLPLVLLGLLLLPRGSREWTVFVVALLPYLIVPLIASTFARYRVPAVPLVFLLSGHGLVRLRCTRRTLAGEWTQDPV